MPERGKGADCAQACVEEGRSRGLAKRLASSPVRFHQQGW